MTKAQREVIQSNLNNEKKVIKELQQVYRQASKDVEDKISALNARTDMQNLQSIVYQRQYQEALQSQLDGILDSMQTEEFTTIADYLTNCYTNGYTGAMYDISKQGIPIITPINQEKVVKALQTDSQLSTSMYNRLGEDVNYLKNSIRAELSRGIASGESWLDMAEHIANGMNSPFDTAINNAIRIARTEGNRIQNEAQLDAMQEAKDNGADVVKQWCATLDDATREEHQELDGQIRELDDEFEVDGYSAMAPGEFGEPEMDINCRCCMLQRARWALDKDELAELEERAEYFGLDKTDDFEDFKEKYLDATAEIQHEAEIFSGDLQFVEAASIKEAEEFARSCGIDNVSFKGVSLEVANDMNRSLVDAFNYCPELKEQISFYGSGQEMNRLLKADLKSYYTESFTKRYVELGYDPTTAALRAEKLAGSYASKSVGRIESNCYAFARSGNVRNATDELSQILDKYKGIGVNTKQAKNYEAMTASVKADVAAGFHPVGCDTVKSIFDHEFGHALDYEYNLSASTDLASLYGGTTRSEIRNGLSGYATNDVAEFIAEGYSEYVNNPNPRELASKIGAVIEAKVK